MATFTGEGMTVLIVSQWIQYRIQSRVRAGSRTLSVAQLVERGRRAGCAAGIPRSPVQISGGEIFMPRWPSFRFAKNESPCLESNQGLRSKSDVLTHYTSRTRTALQRSKTRSSKSTNRAFRRRVAPAQQICLSRRGTSAAAEFAAATNHLKCQPPLISFFSNPNQTFEGLNPVISPKSV